MKTLFFGTPALAVPYLELLAQQTDLQAVVTTPDEPSGRGYERKATPVKTAALALNKPVLQPETLKDPTFLPQLQSYAAELAIVVAYGKLLPPAVLKSLKQGFINVHFSLLPAYRGAAPIQRALMQGEKETGVSLFWLDEGMDTGPIFLQKRLTIDDQDDAESLRQKLVPLGIDALKEVFARVVRGEVTRTPQTGKASLAPSLKKDEGKIHWSQAADAIANLVRGTTPWPGAFTFLPAQGKSLRLKIQRVEVRPACPEAPKETPEGGIVYLEREKGFVVKCSRQFLLVLQVQPEGKRAMAAWDFWQGARLKIGDKLG